MTRESIRKLWWIFSWFALLFGLFAFVRTTGMTPISDPFGVFSHEPDGVPVLALPIEIVSFSFSLGLYYLWISKTTQSAWARKIPVPPFFNESDIDATTLDGKAFQAVVITVFFVAPFVLLLLLSTQYLKAKIFFSVIHGPTVPLGLHWWCHFDTRGLYRAAARRTGYFVVGDAHGPQYYPLLTWVYFVAVLATTAGVAAIFRKIFRNK